MKGKEQHCGPRQIRRTRAEAGQREPWDGRALTYQRHTLTIQGERLTTLDLSCRFNHQIRSASAEVLQCSMVTSLDRGRAPLAPPPFLLDEYGPSPIDDCVGAKAHHSGSHWKTDQQGRSPRHHLFPKGFGPRLR